MKNHALNLKLGAHQLTWRSSNQGMTKKDHTQEKAKRRSGKRKDPTLLKLQVQSVSFFH